MKANPAIINLIGAIYLCLVLYEFAGHYFGWSQYRSGDWITMAIGALSGGLGVHTVGRMQTGSVAGQ